MTTQMYPPEELDENYDDGTMPENVAQLAAGEASRKLVADLRSLHRNMRCCEIVSCHTVSMIDEAGL